MCDKPEVTITATELKQNLGKYLDYVIANNEVVITKNGSKVVRLSLYLTEYDRYQIVKERAVDYNYAGKKVSYEKFLEISEESDLRMELINGQIVLLSSPNIWHQEILGELYVVFRDFLQGKQCRVVMAPFDIHLCKQDFTEKDVVQPDLVIVCDADEEIDEAGRYHGTPTLVVEILSPSTRSKDMVDKLNIYMLSGVREFWIVDLEHQYFLVYAFQNRKIVDFTTYRKGDQLISSSFPGLKINMTEVFPRLH